jgi:hypothetical protein
MAKVQAITQRVQAALRDANYDSWPEAAIHDAILEGEKVIVIYRPDAAPVNAELTLVAGIEQSIAALTPAPNRLLSVKYNRAGNVNGRSIRRVGLGDIDAIRPDWRSAAQSTIIREFMHDEREPLLFYVNPPAAVGAKVQLSYSAIPAQYGTVDANTSTTVNDLYEPMLIDWALYRLFGHDVEGSVNMARSQQALGTFERMLGVKLQSDITSSPKNQEHRK